MRNKTTFLLIFLFISLLLFSAEDEDIIKKYLGKGVARGEILFSNTSRFNYLGAFNYFIPVYADGRYLFFIDYRHSVPLKQQEGSSAFDIDHAEFKFAAGLKRLISPSLILSLDYRHYHLIRVDIERLDSMDLVMGSIESPGFRMIAPGKGLDFKIGLGAVVNRENVWGNGAFDAFLRYNFASLSPASNLGVELSFSAIFSGSRFAADKEGRLRLNLFSRGGEVTSFYLGFIDNEHPLGLMSRGIICGVSWEEGRVAVPSSPSFLSVSGRLATGAINVGGALVGVGLGGEWRLFRIGENFSLMARIDGANIILTDRYNNAFYSISGGLYSYYRDQIGVGISFYHRSNHLILREITNPRSSINSGELVVLTSGWGNRSDRGGILLPSEPPLGKVNLFFALGKVVNASFVPRGKVNYKYGVRFDFKEMGGVIPFIRYYGEYVSGIRLDDYELGVTFKNGWVLSLRKLRDDEGYGGVDYFMVGVARSF